MTPSLLTRNSSVVRCALNSSRQLRALVVDQTAGELLLVVEGERRLLGVFVVWIEVDELDALRSVRLFELRSAARRTRRWRGSACR